MCIGICAGRARRAATAALIIEDTFPLLTRVHYSAVSPISKFPPPVLAHTPPSHPFKCTTRGALDPYPFLVLEFKSRT